MKTGKYETRYCAFVDILGFAQLMEELRLGHTSYEAVRHLLKYVHSPLANTLILREANVMAQSISDAVAVSAAVNYHGLLALFGSLQRMAIRLLCRGYFVRGAVVKGLLYHADGMVFGTALIRAFQIESQVARFPRIIVTSDVVKDACKYAADQEDTNALLSTKLARANDGPMYLHVLQQLATEHVAKEFINKEGTWDTIRDQIIRRLEQAMDNPNHFEKVQWFAQYWNNSLTTIRGEPIYGPGLTHREVDTR